MKLYPGATESPCTYCVSTESDVEAKGDGDQGREWERRRGGPDAYNAQQEAEHRSQRKHQVGVRRLSAAYIGLSPVKPPRRLTYLSALGLHSREQRRPNTAPGRGGPAPSMFATDDENDEEDAAPRRRPKACSHICLWSLGGWRAFYNIVRRTLLAGEEVGPRILAMDLR